MASRFGARWTGFAALTVRWTTAGLPTIWMGELLPTDAFDHMDVGGRAMSGTIAEIEFVVRDGLDDFLHRALADSRFLHDLHFPHIWTHSGLQDY